MRIKRIYILYVFQLFFIGLFMLVLLGYRLETTKKTFFENEMFSPAVRGLQMSNNQLNEDVHFQIPVLPDLKYTISRYLAYGESEIIRGVYGTEDVFGFSGLIGEGRYFTADDYASANPVAVLGSEAAEKSEVQDGKRYYIYNNIPYEVIGIFAKQGNLADKAVFLNLTALDRDISQLGGIYYVDAADKSTVSSVINQIYLDVGNAFTISEVAFEPTASRVLGKMCMTLFLFSAISALLCLIITSMFLVSGQRYSIAVKKLCGMTKAELFRYYGGIMLLIAAAAFLLILGAMFLMTHVVKNGIFVTSSVGSVHYLLTAVILIGICLCNTHYITKLSDAVDISGVLKGI